MMDTIGTALNSIISRYQSIREGKDFDPENNPLNAVEKSLNRYGIAIRKDAVTFKSLSDVLTEISNKWKLYNDVQRNDIATQLAGTRQRNQFLTLMQNMDMAMQQQATQADSAGNAMKRYQVYAESTEAKLNDLKNAGEQMWMSLINSNAINSFIGGLTNIVQNLNALTQTTTGTKVAILSLITAITLLTIGIKALGVSGIDFIFVKTIPSIINYVSQIGLATLATKGLTAAVGLLGKGLNFLVSPVGLIITAIGIAATAVANHIQHQKELRQQTDELTQSYKDLNQALKENNVQQMQDSSQSIKTAQTNLINLINQRNQLEKQLENADRNPIEVGTNTLASEYDNISASIKNLNAKISEQQKVFQDAGIVFDETTGKIDELDNAEKLLAINKNVQAIKEESDAQIEKDQTMIDLISRYQELNNIQNKNAAQQKEMSNIAKELNNYNDEFTISIDKNGNAILTNTALLGKQKDALELDIQTTKENTQVKIDNAINSMTMEYNNTTYTISQVEARIEAYKAEIDAISQLQMAKGGLTSDLTYVPANIQKMLWFYSQVSSAINKIKDSVKGISTSGVSGGDYTPSGSYSTDKKSYTFATSSADQYQQSLSAINTSLKDQDTLISDIQNKIKLYQDQDTDESRIKAIQEQNNLYEQQNIKIQKLQSAMSQYKTIQNSIKAEFLKNWQVDVTGYTKEQLQSLYDSIFQTREFTSEESKNQYENLSNLFKSLMDDWNDVGDAVKSVNSEIITTQSNILETSKDISSQVKEAAQSVIESEQKLVNKQLDKLEEKLNSKLESIDASTQAYEDKHQAIIDDLQAEIDAMEEQNNQLKEQEQRAEHLKAISDAEADLEKSRTELSKIENNRNVKLLTESGWTWIADPQEVESATEAVTNAQQKLKDAQKAYNDWENDLEYQHHIDKLQAEIDYQNNLIETRRKADEEKKTELQNSFDEEKKRYEDYYNDIDSLTTEWLNGLVDKYGNNWDKILEVVQDKAGKIADLTQDVMNGVNVDLNDLEEELEKNTGGKKSNNNSSSNSSKDKYTDKNHSSDSRNYNDSGMAQMVSPNGNPASVAPGYVDELLKQGYKFKYDKGGEAYGKGVILKDVIEPERILDPKTTTLFNKLVDFMPNLTFLNNFRKFDFSNISPKDTTISQVIQNLSLEFPYVKDSSGVVETLRNLPLYFKQQIRATK